MPLIPGLRRLFDLSMTRRLAGLRGAERRRRTGPGEAAARDGGRGGERIAVAARPEWRTGLARPVGCDGGAWVSGLALRSAGRRTQGRPEAARPGPALGLGRRLALGLGLGLGLGMGLAQPAWSCSLALALALDVSSSVDPGEYALQADGLASALEDPDVKEAILAPGGLVYIAVYEWSGRWQHAVVAGWTELNTPGEIDALAARIRGFGRSHADYPTALGHAIGFAARLLAEAPVCDRRVLDISGDGANNDGYEPAQAYGSFELQDVTVNALVVGGQARPQLTRYFETMVIKGPGAFVEVARDYRDYAKAMKRKLLREIRPPMAIGLLMREGPG
ncbi:MAG: DUF1194 domain-containing protein, partial [Pseudomonadota bacterium]|nr:DUF1194 domain-containing protein [Pseudomonadota bacterium]